MQRKTVCAVGWGAAAAMAALVAVLPCGKSAGSGSAPKVPRPRKVAMPDVPSRLRPAAQQSERRSVERRESLLRGVKVKCKDVNWRPHDKWNVPALYEILGDVPPDVRAVAERIREAHKARSVEAALACVSDAEACPNPVVRAMMVDALRLFAIVGNGGGDRQASDRARLAAFDAALRFVNDRNEFVSENAVNTLAVATRSISDEGERLCAIVDAIKATGGKVLGDYEFQFGVLSRFRNNDQKRDVRLLAIAQAIEELPEGEVRRNAEEMFYEATDEKFAGSRGIEEKIAWKDDLAGTGAQLFDNSETKGREFAREVDVMTLCNADAFKGREAEVEEACKMFTNPQVAMHYLTWKGDIRKSAVERYGEGPEADAWYERELAFQVQRLHQLDERIEKAREERERKLKAAKGGSAK